MNLPNKFVSDIQEHLHLIKSAYLDIQTSSTAINTNTIILVHSPSNHLLRISALSTLLRILIYKLHLYIYIKL